MKVNNVDFNVTLEQILNELINQLRIRQLPYFEKGYKRSGDHLMVQCPYHSDGQERRPSAGIRESDGLFHCFTCNEVHGLAEVISYCLGYNDITGKEGLKWLLKNFATVEVEERKDVKLDFERSRNNIINSGINESNRYNETSEQNLETVDLEELEKYRYYHPYMYKRKLTNEIIELFDIGYDKDTDCITFPVRDIDGNCLFIARRSVKTKYFNYPQGVEKPLYGLYELFKGKKAVDRLGNGLYQYTFPDEVIVCESMLDALTCWVYGKYAVALNGLGNELQFKQLRDLPCRKLILATDNDVMGMAARSRIRKAIGSIKLVTEYILPESKKDINELTKDEFDNLREIF